MHSQRCLPLRFVIALLVLGSPMLAEPPSREATLAAMRKAATFAAEKMSLEGGYQRAYSEDLTYANAGKGAEGLKQFSVTGGTTPTMGFSYLVAWETTGDDFYLEAARATAYGLMRGQLCSGGWDYTTELDPKIRSTCHYRVDGECPTIVPKRRPRMTNLDNNSTQDAVRFLIHLDRATGFKDKKIHEAARYCLDGLLRAQFPNGAWPQRFGHDHHPDPAKHPIKPGSFQESWSRKWPGRTFYSHYTFNDGVMHHTMDVLLEASHIYKEPRYQAAAEKAGDFMILAQMPEPQPAWGQQYDYDMHPAWGRYFEPPGVTGRESLQVMDSLLFLYRETGKKKYLEPIPPALDYLRRSIFEHNGRKVIARFYEVKTNRPLFVTKGTLVGTRVHFGDPTDGYEVTYDASTPAAHYGYFGPAESIERVQQEYDRVRAADPATLRRPDRSKGFAPGTGPSAVSPEELGQRVAAAIATMEERGAWISKGDMGGPGRLVRVRAAQDLVARIDGKLIPIPGGSTLEVFEGKEPPAQRFIGTGQLSANLQLFCTYLNAQ